LGSPVSEYSRSVYVKVERPLSNVLDLLSEKYMSANVKIVAKKETFSSTTVYDGSGIIFKKQAYSGNYYRYYCLTNNHVVVANVNPTYFVVDHLAVQHNATLVCNSDDYDLAVVSFVSDTNFEVLPIDDKDVSIGDKVIALGNPLGSMNSVTVGNVTNLSEIVNVPANSGETDYSNVNFAIITHDAKINSGSSGGALISYDFKIIGINFATGNDATTHEFVEGYAVPHAKIKEFLTANDVTY
ncbi:MAG: serine protease, partial [Clostridia bacterium]|nr:serine protease [Clostridia bacterium]